MQFGSRNHASTNSRCSRLIFLAFSAAFHCFDLAEANEEGVKAVAGTRLLLSCWNLHNSNSLGVSRCFPDNYSDLLKLKGVGEYAADCFVFLQ
jgi:A/G-specific adenine glycosylase